MTPSIKQQSAKRSQYDGTQHNNKSAQAKTTLRITKMFSTIAFYDTELVTAIKSFIASVPGNSDNLIFGGTGDHRN